MCLLLKRNLATALCNRQKWPMGLDNPPSSCLPALRGALNIVPKNEGGRRSGRGRQVASQETARYRASVGKWRKLAGSSTPGRPRASSQIAPRRWRVTGSLARARRAARSLPLVFSLDLFCEESYKSGLNVHYFSVSFAQTVS